jgi:hypothetical protein
MYDYFARLVGIVQDEDFVGGSAWSHAQDDVTTVASIDTVHDRADCDARFRTHSGRKNIPRSGVELVRRHSHDDLFAGLHRQPILLDDDPWSQRPQDGSVSGITIAMVIQRHGVDRPNNGGYRRFYISPERLRVIGHPRNVSSRIIIEFSVTDLDDGAERILIEMTILDRVERDVLLCFAISTGPNYSS